MSRQEGTEEREWTAQERMYAAHKAVASVRNKMAFGRRYSRNDAYHSLDEACMILAADRGFLNNDPQRTLKWLEGFEKDRP